MGGGRQDGSWHDQTAFSHAPEMVEESERATAESLLQSLLIGRGIYGLRFRAGMALLLWHADLREPLEVEFTVGGPWRLDSPGGPLDGAWRDLDDEGYVSLAEFVGRCRSIEVVAVRLTGDADLTLTFADGHRLTAAALDRYESWEVDGGPYKVLSLPGRDVAWWTNLDHRSA